MAAEAQRHPLSRIRSIAPIRRLVISLRQWREGFIERRLNISTGTVLSYLNTGSGQFADANAYQPLGYSLARRYLEPLQAGTQDVCFDIGCGMGRVVCLMAQLPVREVVGVELDGELAEVARRNAANMRNRTAPVRILTEDASKTDYSLGTAFWLFNPFGPTTLEHVAAAIAQTVERHPRRIRLAYVNPYHAEVLQRLGYEQYAVRRSRLYKTYATYWTLQTPNQPL